MLHLLCILVCLSSISAQPPLGPRNKANCPVTNKSITITANTPSVRFDNGQKLYFADAASAKSYADAPRDYWLAPHDLPLSGMDGKRGLPDLRNETLHCPFTNESMVISMQTLSSNSWPMFTFGFGAIFVLTQVPGLPCLQDQHIILRLLPTLIFIGVYVGVYLATPGWTNPAVVFFIPSAEYLGAIAVNYLFWIVLRCLHGKNPDATQATAAISAISAISTDNSKSKSKSGVVVELADIGKERSGGGGNGSNSSDSGGGNEKESSSAEEDSTELKNESITVAPPLDVDVVVVGEPTTTPEKRKLWIALVVLTYVIVIVCSVVAQVSLEIQGKSGGALLVYLPMCCLVPASLLMLKMALPYSKAAHEVETDRIGPRGVTRCCVHL